MFGILAIIGLYLDWSLIIITVFIVIEIINKQGD